MPSQRTKVTVLADGRTTSDGYFKSRYSQGATNCAEVKPGATTALRDTQNRELGAIGVSAGEWTRLMAALS